MILMKISYLSFQACTSRPQAPVLKKIIVVDTNYRKTSGTLAHKKKVCQCKNSRANFVANKNYSDTLSRVVVLKEGKTMTHVWTYKPDVADSSSNPLKKTTRDAFITQKRVDQTIVIECK